MTKFMCDGHEYNVKWDSKDKAELFNNYGTHVATLYPEHPTQEYWCVWAAKGELIASWHENDVVDNLLDSQFVRAYVAWAMDNETVEEH